MNSYINGILQVIRKNDKYHQIAMILFLIILVILLLFQLSKIQDNRKLLINAKSDFALCRRKNSTLLQIRLVLISLSIIQKVQILC